MGDRFRWWYALLLIPLVAVGVWVGVRSQRVLEGPQDVLEALQRGAGPALPTGVPGAVARSSVETYDRETLYDFLGDEAKRYLELGFQTCRVASYTFDPPDESVVEAALLRFGMPSGAQEGWRIERAEGSTPVDGMDGVVASGGMMVAVRGRDLLRLRADSDDDRARSRLTRLVRAWLEQREGNADE